MYFFIHYTQIENTLNEPNVALKLRRNDKEAIENALSGSYIYSIVGNQN